MPAARAPQRGNPSRLAGVGCRRRRFAPAAVALAAGFALLGWFASAALAATAHVQYVSSTSVYLDVGRTAGLVEGATCRVERDGKEVAQLVVEFAADHSAGCRIVSSTSAPVVGDLCTFTPVPAAGGAAGPAVPASPGTEGSAGGYAGEIGGTIAFTYRRSSETDGSLTNPGMRADIRWDGPEQRELGLRFRADRPAVELATPPSSPLPEEKLRIYEGELRYRGAAERFEVRGGRFIPPRLELLGYMDGGGVAFRPTAAVQLGLAGGGGAQLVSNGFTTSGWKLGGFVEAADTRRGPARWRALAGGGQLQDPDVTRRQFLFLNCDQRAGARARLWQHLEVDFNPQWKRDLGEPAVDLTQVALGTQVELHPRLDLALGYDSRRDLLLPEQRLVPPDQLTLERTQGVHGALHVRFAPWTTLRLGTDLRTRSDGTQTQRSWDAVFQGGRAALSLFAHANVYDAAPGRGELFDGGLLARPTDLLRLDLAGGTHLARDVSSSAGTADVRTNWVRAGAGLESPWGLWFDASGEWRSGQSGNELRLEVGQRL